MLTTIANNDLIYIEAAHDSGMVLGITINDEVILETLVPNKPEQLWEQGDPDNDGYFNLINSNTRGLMTAVSSSALDVRGNIKSLTIAIVFEVIYYTNWSFLRYD
jgi:hypothetical protein